MKTIKPIFLAFTALLLVSFVSAQTAEEVINNYMNALGGKDQVNSISSVYMEGSMDAMGNQGTIKTTLLHGKGYKQEIDVMGTNVVMCWTDTMGWQINPMSGNYSAEKMTENQFKAGRDQIYTSGLFSNDLTAKGYQTELVGQEQVVGVNAWKLKIVSPDNTESFYFFDPDTWYLLKTVQNFEMMGQFMEVSTNFSNYQKPENGFAMPYKVETNYGGQFFLTAVINKVDINQPVDEAIFVKP